MHRARWFCLLLLISCAPFARGADQQRPRLIVLTDIGGDPDDQQSLIRLLTFANEFEIEALIASASGVPGELDRPIVQPHLIHEIVDAYGHVHGSLSKHASHFPAAAELKEKVRAGNPHRGIKNVGADHDTDGSRMIIELVDRPDDRPANIVIWGGSTELAQALWRVRNDRSPEQFKTFLQKMRVHAINHQDDTGPWILENFPDLFYILSRQDEGRDMRESAYRGMYLGGDESLTSREWVDQHVRVDHGPLGALYPTDTWTEPNPHGTLKEGDTPSWFYFLPNGLSDPEHPEWGGWGGRFQLAAGGLYRDARDSVDGTTDARCTVWRWRPNFQNHFAARMDWCVRDPKQANHAPIATIAGDTSKNIIQRSIAADEEVRLDASASSDPDGNSLKYRWWYYREPSSYEGQIPESNEAVFAWNVPTDARGKSIHLILEVIDDGQPSLTSYRRVVLDVNR